MSDTLTPVLTDNWDVDRAWTLASYEDRGGYGALYEITPDWHPIIDRLPGLEGAFCAAGFSGHGFKMSPVVGQLVAEMVVDGKASSLDITALRLARFADNEPIKTASYSSGVMG